MLSWWHLGCATLSGQCAQTIERRGQASRDSHLMPLDIIQPTYLAETWFPAYCYYSDVCKEPTSYIEAQFSYVVRGTAKIINKVYMWMKVGTTHPHGQPILATVNGLTNHLARPREDFMEVMVRFPHVHPHREVSEKLRGCTPSLLQGPGVEGAIQGYNLHND